MTDNQDAVPTPVGAESVRVSLLGGDAQTFDYEEGLMVRDWLARAAVQVGGNGVSLNGEMADLDSPVPAGAILIVAAKVANG